MIQNVKLEFSAVCVFLIVSLICTLIQHTAHRSCIMCVNTDCETPTNVTKRLIPIDKLIKVTEVLQSWSSLITLFHLKTAAVISAGDTTQPLSLQPFRGAVSASHHYYMTKFGETGYMPSAKYSRYFAATWLTANKMKTFLLTVHFIRSVTIILSDFTLYFLFCNPSLQKEPVFCMVCYLLIQKNHVLWSFTKKGIFFLTTFWRLRRNKMNTK